MKPSGVVARILGLGILIFITNPAIAQSGSDLGPEVRGALLRGLDKITARITTFEAPLGEEVQFGTLRIIAQTCRKRPPEEAPEVAVFLEIDEERPGESGRQPLFSGWMFASSPALSALEHPVYDVWVIDCSTADADSDLPESLKSPATPKADANRE
ncbi:MAG: DUF2155 domain-containing protein [Rhodospirillaceae bacterium]|jgi:hypothetical protein|nr:DUF2155 domain-containing protein [Rhodospirillaceae bacterium]MBT4487121.1 DUF2155 domain-containing protein [Rhodospirillaceae bacterium]MBT5195868.1 DUF2155 domain-containing protein [Rhodospirillaceae bacterium]MBT5896057.1 DUF2155 domain-containing protein [Rhodospirillaceae bacterium]MBT6426072.1 DUF2155 domain-containing protein [Rhodospirillaceae bacterium]